MNTPNGERISSILRANTRMVAWAIVLVLLVDVIVAIRHGFSPDSTIARNKPSANGASTTPDAGALPTDAASAIPSVSPSETGVVPGGTGKTLTGPPGKYIPGEGTIPFGIDQYGKNTIYIAYYWGGDSTRTSAFLPPGTQPGAVDEADAFRTFVAYVNKYANGGTLMGFPFNLHGRKIIYDIYETSHGEEAAQAIAADLLEKPPFTAISSHGGASDYICDSMWKAKIFNLSTYDLGRYPGGLYKGTNKYCLPQGLSWENQVNLSVSYIAHQNKTTMFNRPAKVPEKRVYGVLYASYPGLADSVKVLVAKLKAAGVDVADVEEMPPGLADSAQGPATAAVGKFNKAHVNTVISPDGAAPITFTHAAQARGAIYDYYVWPCSGQDAAGQVRLFDPAQWSRASGLSCYDALWNLDLTLDKNARDSQWFHQYQEIKKKEPPATTPLIYQSLLTLLAGITNAGRDVTVERFRAGLEAFRYPGGLTRYDAITGPTAKASHFMVSLGCPDESQIGDVAYVYWDSKYRTEGNTSAGNYRYSDDRYRPGHVF